MKKEYLVTVKTPDEFDSLHEDLITDRTRGHYLADRLNGIDTSIPNVPDRPVELLNYRPGSLRTAHYSLTDQEAEQLRNDQRVASVDLHMKHRENLKVIHCASQTGLFDKSFVTNNQHLNWALKSSTRPTDPFVSSQQLNTTYPYCLDGEHVDIVIVDSGITPNHPEFAVNADGTGGSRVKQIDWYAETGLPGSMPVNPYVDEDGHGTHVAGIAAGNTCGWARKANIYSIKAITGWNPGIDIYEVFDLIRLWHLNKEINPVTGKKNPTIVNNSWAFIAVTGSISGISYRGTWYPGNLSASTRASYGLVNYTPWYGGNLHGVRVPSIDAEIEECIAAGVIVVAAAGNYAHKIDIPGGVDYDNYYVDNWGAEYYNRGATPGGTVGVICVGNIDSITPEQKSTSSECGPRVDIYAPGTSIMSSCTFGVSDARNNSYFKAKLSGTSMASPQVLGALSLLLQSKPWLTPTQALTALKTLSVTNRITDTSPVSYTNYRSLQGSTNRYLYMPYTGNDTGKTVRLRAIE